MNSWSNIQISPQDPEIVKINNFEKKLGKLPNKVRQIRELITRFEVCHFKYQEHLSIITLPFPIDSHTTGQFNFIQNVE